MQRDDRMEFCVRIDELATTVSLFYVLRFLRK